jgi:signal transduction histidine kinase
MLHRFGKVIHRRKKPLAVILAALQKEFLEDVMGSSHHLLSLINEVLDLSKVQDGKMELELAEVRIRGCWKAAG